MEAQREPMAGRVAGPLRSGVLWGLMALAATGVLALLIGGGGAVVTWVMERFDAAEFGWPGNLVFGAAVVGVALSIPAAAWAVSYASTQRAPGGRALLATGLGVASLIAISVVDRAMGLVGGAGMALAVALPYREWHRLTARIIPVVAAILVGAALIDVDGNPLTIVANVVAYPVAAVLVWLGDGAWRLIRRWVTTQ